MKRILLLGIVAIFLAGSLQAQNIRYGFKFGVAATSINDLSFDLVNVEGEAVATPSDANEDGRISVTTGFFAEIALSENFKIQPEFLFTSLGNKGEGFKYDQLQLPIAFKYEIRDFYVLVGPQASVKVSFFEQSDDYRSIDFAGFGGLGFFFDDNIFIEARYTLGFSEIFEDDAEIPVIVPVEGSNTVNTDTRYRNLSGSNAYLSVVLGYRL